MIALGTLAAEAGYRVRYTLGSKLVNELVEADDHKQLTTLINRFGRVYLILVDELGYLRLDRRGAELLFQVLTERERSAHRYCLTSHSLPGQRHSLTRDCALRLLTG